MFRFVCVFTVECTCFVLCVFLQWSAHVSFCVCYYAGMLDVKHHNDYLTDKNSRCLIYPDKNTSELPKLYSTCRAHS